MENIDSKTISKREIIRDFSLTIKDFLEEYDLGDVMNWAGAEAAVDVLFNEFERVIPYMREKLNEYEKGL